MGVGLQSTSHHGMVSVLQPGFQNQENTMVSHEYATGFDTKLPGTYSTYVPHLVLGGAHLSIEKPAGFCLEAHTH